MQIMGISWEREQSRRAVGDGYEIAEKHRKNGIISNYTVTSIENVMTSKIVPSVPLIVFVNSGCITLNVVPTGNYGRELSPFL